MHVTSNHHAMKRPLPPPEQTSAPTLSLEKHVAAGTVLEVSSTQAEGIFLSEVRAHVFNLKHITLLSKLSEGFLPTGSGDSTGAGAEGPGSESGLPIAS